MTFLRRRLLSIRLLLNESLDAGIPAPTIEAKTPKTVAPSSRRHQHGDARYSDAMITQTAQNATKAVLRGQRAASGGQKTGRHLRQMSQAEVRCQRVPHGNQFWRVRSIRMPGTKLRACRAPQSGSLSPGYAECLMLGRFAAEWAPTAKSRLPPARRWRIVNLRGGRRYSGHANEAKEPGEQHTLKVA